MQDIASYPHSQTLLCGSAQIVVKTHSHVLLCWVFLFNFFVWGCVCETVDIVCGCHRTAHRKNLVLSSTMWAPRTEL